MKWVGGWQVGGEISWESVWSFHQIYYVNSQIVLKFSHPIPNIFLQGISNPGCGYSEIYLSYDYYVVQCLISVK